jgi:N-acetylgalactosamine-6-sulfatase
MNKRSRFITSLSVFACIISVLAPAASSSLAAEQPNIIFVFADDLGWGDLGCYGNNGVKTPNLDRLARQGTQFTQFYVNFPTCSPSRTAIMTGHFPNRHRVHGYFANPAKNKHRDMPNALNPKAPMLTRRLQQAGYTTGHFGKWHLSTGDESIDTPPASAYGIDHAHLAHQKGWDVAKPKHPDGLWHPPNRSQSTELIVNETIAFIERHQREPFFANVWLLDTHATLNPTQQQRNPYGHLNPKGVDFVAPATVYNAVVTKMDRQIGRLLHRIDELELTKKTIFIFSSDNGPEVMRIRNAAHSGVGRAGPLRGRKRSLYEGGVRVPFLVRWPGEVPAGRVDTQSVVAGVDLMPTLCHLAGATLPRQYKPDGENVIDILKGNARQREMPLFWEYRWRQYGHVFHRSPMLAIRDGDWKLLMNPGRSRVELYNIVKDPREMNNRAGNKPKLIADLAQKLMEYHNAIPDGRIYRSAGKNDYPWPGK